MAPVPLAFTAVMYILMTITEFHENLLISSAVILGAKN
jgi:hypothetical protein